MNLALIKTVHTNAINHDPACTFVMTGSEVPGKPSIGSWLAYGLGSESNDLPAFVVFTPKFPPTGNGQALFTRMWSSGFLPSQVQRRRAARRRRSGAVRAESRRASMPTDRRTMLDALTQLNQRELRTLRRSRDPDAHRPVRNGLSHAEFACRNWSTCRRSRKTSWTCTARRQAPRARSPQCAAGAAPGRTRRARGADPASRLGPARQLAGGA